MKLFLIKLGKAFSSIKRDGIIKGGKRILDYLIVFLTSLLKQKKGDVLFVSGGVGDSALYRAFNQAEELRLNKIPADTTIQDDPFLLRYVDKFKIFVFHRTIFTPLVEKMVSKIKQQGKVIIFETDDLVFDFKYIQATDLYRKMSHFEKKQYEKGVGEEILKDPEVKFCSTSTNYLKKILESYGKRVFVNKNKINLPELKLSQKIICQKKEKDSQEIRIGYFSGTMSHNKDFATISDPLMKIMGKYSNVKLVLVGPLDLENKLNQFKDRIIHSGLVSRKKHYQNVSEVDINLAPLETNNPFCDSKSELKFFEAGIVKVPTVAVYNESFTDAVTDGIDGFLAKDEDEWFQKIEKLIIDKYLRKKMGEKAYEKCLEDYTTKNSHNEEYYNFLREEIKKI